MKNKKNLKKMYVEVDKYKFDWGGFNSSLLLGIPIVGACIFLLLCVTAIWQRECHPYWNKSKTKLEVYVDK